MNGRKRAPDVQVLEDLPEGVICVMCETNDIGLSVPLIAQDTGKQCFAHVVCAMPEYYSKQLNMVYKAIQD
jgi:hypothetical protein